jgi:EcsC protein family
MSDGGSQGELTPYDQKAWAAVEHWREKKLSNRARKLIPSRVRDGLQGAGRRAKGRFDELPKAAAFEELFMSAVGGTVELGSRVATASVRQGRILDSFREHGHHVDELSDISALTLRDIDKVKPNLALGYTTTATLEGAAAGFMISGGEIVAAGGTVLGAGAGAAPGIGTILGVMAADAAAVLLASNRAVAHTAAYYGYDIDQPGERLFALGVLSMGTASETGKAAAYVELNKLVQMLARRATWEQLNQNVVTGVVEKVFTRLGYRLTQRKLGQAVPVLGTAIGAGMNARVLLSVVDNADHVYRERFLREKYGIDLAGPEPVNVDLNEEYDVIDVAEILVVEQGGDDRDSSPASNGDEPAVSGGGSELSS